MLKKIWSYKLTLIVICLILYATLMPGDAIPDVPIVIPHMDKLVHFGMFFVLAVTYTFEHLRRHQALPKSLFSFVGGILFAVLTEIFQVTLTATRAFEVGDILADSVGIIIGIVAWYVAFTYCHRYIKFLYQKPLSN